VDAAARLVGEAVARWGSMAKIVKDKDLGFNAIIAEIEKMHKSSVKIGFFANQVTKAEQKVNSNTGELRNKVPGQSMANIARENEYGVVRRGKRVPARPFMSTSFDENRELINRVVAKEYDKILAGKSTVYKSLSALGIWFTGIVQKKIRSIQSPPNSPLTIELKGSSKPLIDFGQMISSVTHEVTIK